MPLWPFLDLSASSQESLSELYRIVYEREYVRDDDGTFLVLNDWRGTAVHFTPHKFDHAFSRSSDYRGHGVHDDGFCPERSRRILWIRQTLLGTAPETHLRRVPRQDQRGRTVIRQNYLVPAEKYLVVVDQRADGRLFFHTAYPCDATYFTDVAMREGARIDVRRA